jgi:putative membrane protein
MMHGHGMMNGWGMMGPLMWVFMLLLWGFAIFGLICAVRWLVTRGKAGEEHKAPETPLELLKARYARGEIGREEFERMRKELE